MFICYNNNSLFFYNIKTFLLPAKTFLSDNTSLIFTFQHIQKFQSLKVTLAGISKSYVEELFG